MLEFIILMVVLDILLKIKVKTEPVPIEKRDPWGFDSVDDAMEYKELRKTGWKGNAADFYRWKSEE